MIFQMYKSKLFCISQIILYIPNYFIYLKLIYIFQKVLLTITWNIHAAIITLDGGQIILYIMASQMYKSKLFYTSQIILYIPNYFVHPKLFCTSQIILYIPNYLVHPKLFCTSRIILYIPN